MFQRSWKGLYRFHFSVCPSLRRRAALWSLRIFHSIRWIFAHFINQHQPVWCVLIVFVNSKTCQNFCHFLTHVVGPTKKPPPTMIILTYDSTYNFGLGLCVFFSCDQAALWTVQSICPSLHLSVRLSHLFHYIPIIVSSWNFQELLPLTEVVVMLEIKVRGQRSRYRSNPI